MDLSDVFRKLKPVLGEAEAARLWEDYLAADPETRRLLEASLRLEAARSVRSSFEEREILLEPPPAEAAAGPYPLGTVFYGRRPRGPFGLREHELIQHVAIFGRSGAGKTNVAHILLREFLRAGKSVLVFDWKRNYRDLLALPEFSQLEVLTVGRDHAPFFFNPFLPPPGTPPKEWLKKLIEIMGHAYFLGEGVAFLLQEAMDALYRDFGVYEGSNRFPTFWNLKERLQARDTRGRESGWMESALRAVGVLCFGAMDHVLNSGVSSPLEDLLRRPVVLELDALTNSDKTFLIETLLLWIHHFRMAEPARETFKHALLIEEAHHILLGKKQQLTGGESVTDVILREIRELGEAVILLDQHPSLISKPALGNTYTTIAMNLKHRSDVSMMSQAMLLDPEQTDYLGLLPVGWGMVKLQARWPRPFLVQFELFPVEKGTVTDDDLNRRFTDRLGVEGVAKLLYDLWRPIERELWEYLGSQGISRAEIEQRLLEQDSGGDPTKVALAKVEPTGAERAFLADVHQHPADPVSVRYRRLGLSWSAGRAAVTTLAERGLLAVVSLPVPEGRVQLVALTEAGRTASGVAADASARFGGPEHRYWKERLAQVLAAHGAAVRVEDSLGGGKMVDIVAEKDARRIAIEIETSDRHARENVRKCLDAGFQEIIVAVTRRELVAPVARAVALEDGGQRVRVLWVGDVEREFAREPRSARTDGEGSSRS